VPRTSPSKGVVYFCNEDEGSGRSFDLPLRSSGWLIELVSLRDALSQRSGAELGCLAAEKWFHLLKGPVRRVGLPDVPSPAGYALEQFYYPSVERIGAVIREMCR